MYFVRTFVRPNSIYSKNKPHITHSLSLSNRLDCQRFKKSRYISFFLLLSFQGSGRDGEWGEAHEHIYAIRAVAVRITTSSMGNPPGLRYYPGIFSGFSRVWSDLTIPEVRACSPVQYQARFFPRLPCQALHRVALPWVLLASRQVKVPNRPLQPCPCGEATKRSCDKPKVPCPCPCSCSCSSRLSLLPLHEGKGSYYVEV